MAMAMATIEIRLRGLTRLFDSLDPAPLQERALDPNAESYLDNVVVIPGPAFAPLALLAGLTLARCRRRC